MINLGFIGDTAGIGAAGHRPASGAAGPDMVEPTVSGIGFLGILLNLFSRPLGGDTPGLPQDTTVGSDSAASPEVPGRMAGGHAANGLS